LVLDSRPRPDHATTDKQSLVIGQGFARSQTISDESRAVAISAVKSGGHGLFAPK
jgi:hypothetical protein